MRLIDLVKANIDGKWNWYKLSVNECIAMQDIIDNMGLNWAWSTVFTRSDITVENVLYILDNKKLLNSECYEISANESFTLDELLYIEKHRRILYWPFISNNKNITINNILAHPDLPWDWEFLSTRIPISDVIKNKHLPWTCVTIHTFSDIHYIKEHSDIQWKIDLPWYLATLQFVMQNFDLPWNWNNIYKYYYTPSSFEKLSALPDLDPPYNSEPPYALKWKMYSSYNQITSGFIRDNIHEPWDFEALSSNAALTLDIIKRHPNKPWYYDSISKNKGDLGKRKMKIIDILSDNNICFDIAEIIYEYSEKVYKNYE